MSKHGCILLTGATGLLGHYLLRDFVAADLPLAVLARGRHSQTATARVAEVLAFWSEALGRALPMPHVIEGELGGEASALSLADRNWLRKHCRSVVHAAANLSFRAGADGEPWRTNVDGTAALLDLCCKLGITEWHQISTAYVCGRRRGTIVETELDCGQDFHNPYEESKLAAEKLLRRQGSLRLTTYRPAVIVGDSRTGYTSAYSGFYRFLEIGSRLADIVSPGKDSPRHFPMRLPGTGEEPCYLVPVDWVAGAITRLVARPAWHGRTFHLLPAAPIPARLVQQTAAGELNLRGVEWVGPGRIEKPTRLEQMFHEGLEQHWPYLASAVDFRGDNTLEALPDLPPVRIDRSTLQRLVRFAVARDFGRQKNRGEKNKNRPAVYFSVSDSSVLSRRIQCRTYLEEIFPGQARTSRLGKAAGLDIVVALDISGPGGGQWSCCWKDGELSRVRRGLDERAEVTCRLDTATFDAVIRGEQAPQQAFFDQRIELEGDVEIGLKLAVLFEQFLRENPYSQGTCTEATHAVRT
jgi:nucleoside-diphosphate-sugar epimerase/putative sterol carrier protein